MVLLPSSLVETLYQLLSNEIGAYRQLLSLAYAERAALQKGSWVDLLATTQDKSDLLQGLAQWEERRGQMIATLAEKVKLPVGASLSDLITYCDETFAQALSALRQEFLGLAEQLYTLNQENQLLLQTELVRVNGTINYLFTHVSAGTGYSLNGTPGPAAASPLTGNVLNWQI